MKNYFDFNQSDWHNIEKDWLAWWNHSLTRPLIMTDAINYEQYNPEGFSQFVTRFSIDTPVDEVLDYFEERFRATYCYGDGYPKWFPQLGPGVLASFLGSRPDYNPISDTTWFHPLEEIESLKDIQITPNEGNIWWKRVQDITNRAVERWRENFIIGHTDIGGNLDILASLRGSEPLMLDFYDTPEDVLAQSRKITELWFQIYNKIFAITDTLGRGTAGWSPCWFPGKGYMLQSDISYMISPKMFEQFAMPDLIACCEQLDYGFYHMDGIGQINHLDMLLSIERLRGIQWIPGYGQAPPEEWHDILTRIRDAGKLCQLYVSREGAKKLISELGGEGFLLYIREDKPLSLQEADEFFEEISVH